MDAEHPTSPRHLLGRVAATLLALLLLYPLSMGPAIYVAVKLRTGFRFQNRFYAPLYWAIDHTPLTAPYHKYRVWWTRLAGGNPDI